MNELLADSETQSTQAAAFVEKFISSRSEELVKIVTKRAE